MIPWVTDKEALHFYSQRLRVTFVRGDGSAIGEKVNSQQPPKCIIFGDPLAAKACKATPVNIFPTSPVNEFVTWQGEATAVNMFPTGLPKQFIAREGEAPAEQLHRWLGALMECLPLPGNPSERLINQWLCGCEQFR